MDSHFRNSTTRLATFSASVSLADPVEENVGSGRSAGSEASGPGTKVPIGSGTFSRCKMSNSEEADPVDPVLMVS